MRVETVILFVPDVWSCLPTRVEWDGMVATGCCKKPLPQRKVPDETSDPEAQEEDESNLEAEKKEPTHFSELDPKTIKVNDLKDELEARNLSTKGLKSQLIARLTKALKSESERESEGKSDEPDIEMNEEQAVEDIDEEEKKKEKDENKNCKEEKEKIVIDKLNLPELPAILVQPSRTAKNGKFDCTVMSLSLLLDYRQEDNKEHSFEVSLFAELFNEMMMRDFGFRIYRALVEAPEFKEDEKDKKKADKKEDKKDRKEDDRRKDDANENDSDKDDDDSDEDDIDEDRRDKERKKRRKKKIQMYTHDPYLLLSFVYYDQTHCGYLLEKDVEEIFYTLGLMLSRAQVRKLTQKVCKRELLHYRKLTDCPAEGDKCIKTDLIKINIEDLAAGNKKYIPSLKSMSSEAGKESDSEKNHDASSSLISFQGAFVDVGKLMDQLERSEKSRLEADDRLKVLQLQLENLNEDVIAKEKVSQRLGSELEEYKQKLSSTEDDLRKTKTEADRYHKTLSNLRDGLQSSLNIADNTLQRNKSSKFRNSPSKRDNESKIKDSVNGQSDSNCDNSSMKLSMDIKDENME